MTKRLACSPLTGTIFLETKSERVYGLPPGEATEYAYENVLATAKGAIKGTRKPS